MAVRKYFGWATFPEDGVTIQALLEHAKAGALARPEHHDAVRVAGRRWWWGGTVLSHHRERSIEDW